MPCPKKSQITDAEQWAGKAEGISFNVPTSSVHFHEFIKPHGIIANVINEVKYGQLDGQVGLFAAEVSAARMRQHRKDIEFYQHSVTRTNCLIAGNSLVIKNSLLECV